MASSSATLTTDDTAWVKAYASDVLQTFEQEFSAAADRFKEGKRLLDRFNAAIESVLKNGRGYFRTVDEAVNEMCVASALLANTRLKYKRGGVKHPVV
jgi:hypothetical protein